MAKHNCPHKGLFVMFQGADYVELDVHLSKDHVPVIYHDFKIHIAYRKVSLLMHTFLSFGRCGMRMYISFQVFGVD